MKVQPNARENEVVGWEVDPRAGRVLRVRVHAPPVDGKANRVLLAFLAQHLGLSKAKVRLVKGASSRLKTVEVPDGALD